MTALQVCRFGVLADHVEEHLPVNALVHPALKLQAKRCQLLPPLRVIEKSLVHLAHDFLLVESVDFEDEELTLFARVNDVSPSVELHSQTPRCELLPCTDKHVVSIFFRLLSILQRCERAFDQVLQVGLLTDLLHVVLQAAHVDSLRQAVNHFVHQHELSVRPLPVPYLACSDHSLEVYFAQSAVVLRLRHGESVPQRLVFYLSMLPYSERSNGEHDEVLLPVSSNQGFFRFFRLAVADKSTENSLFVKVQSFERQRLLRILEHAAYLVEAEKLLPLREESLDLAANVQVFGQLA